MAITANDTMMVRIILDRGADVELESKVVRLLSMKGFRFKHVILPVWRQVIALRNQTRQQRDSAYVVAIWS